jgi:hypothetical protein
MFHVKRRLGNLAAAVIIISVGYLAIVGLLKLVGAA